MSVINTNLNALVSQESKRSSDLKLSQSMERFLDWQAHQCRERRRSRPRHYQPHDLSGPRYSNGCQEFQ